MLAQLTRTAVYGPVRTVVWQGSAGDRGPYADQTAFEEVWAGAAIGGITLPPSRLLARNNFRLARDPLRMANSRQPSVLRLAIGSGAIAVTRTMGARCSRSGSWRRSGRR